MQTTTYSQKFNEVAKAHWGDPEVKKENSRIIDIVIAANLIVQCDLGSRKHLEGIDYHVKA